MKCRFFESHHCQSCELLSSDYVDTLKMKERELQLLFGEIELFLKTTVGVSKVENSRNKAKLAVFGEQDSIQFGFYDSHAHFKDLEECPLHMEGINGLLIMLKNKLQEYKIIPYSVENKKGELKYVVISKSRESGELLIRFTLRSKESLDRLKKMAQELEKGEMKIAVVTANIQPEHKAVIEGDEELILTSKAYISHQFGDVKLTLGPRSFFQVTPEIAGKLYQSAGEVLKEYKVNSLLDLFCGVGAFSFFAAKSVPDVLGVEISKEAIACAEKSKEFNSSLGKVDFKALDVEAFLKQSDKKYEGILVNPPRRGLNSSIIKNILDQKPRVIVYSSCNAETLARDFKEMENDYKIVSTQIFDMFPYTSHFETLMVIARKDA